MTSLGKEFKDGEDERSGSVITMIYSFHSTVEDWKYFHTWG